MLTLWLNSARCCCRYSNSMSMCTHTLQGISAWLHLTQLFCAVCPCSAEICWIDHPVKQPLYQYLALLLCLARLWQTWCYTLLISLSQDLSQSWLCLVADQGRRRAEGCLLLQVTCNEFKKTNAEAKLDELFQEGASAHSVQRVVLVIDDFDELVANCKVICISLTTKSATKLHTLLM